MIKLSIQELPELQNCPFFFGTMKDDRNQSQIYAVSGTGSE